MNALDLATMLQRLTNLCLDCEHEFQSASNAVQSRRLQKLLGIYCERHHRFAVELQTERYFLDASPPEEPPQKLIGADKAMTNDHDILLECSKVEAIILEQYEQVLKSEMPGNIRQLLTRQISKIRQALEHLRTLYEADV